MHFNYMTVYYLHLRTPKGTQYLEERRDLPDLSAALAAANGAVRKLLHNRLRRAPAELHGSLDIEDERRQPVARIMLADVAHQIS